MTRYRRVVDLGFKSVAIVESLGESPTPKITLLRGSSDSESGYSPSESVDVWMGMDEARELMEALKDCVVECEIEIDRINSNMR